MPLPWRKRDRIKIEGPIFAPFDERNGTFALHWERKDMPDPGAQNYAFESLALAEFSPIGQATKHDGQISPFAQPLYANQGVTVAGIPLTAGQFFLQPLYDPKNGYTAQAVQPLSPTSAFNIVSQNNDPIPTNAVTISGTR